jgi:hypothetical protein
MSDYDFEAERLPEGCDGCGRDAIAAGMARTGWTVRPSIAGFAGIYCASCAHVLSAVDLPVDCSRCERSVRDDEQAEASGWAYYEDVLGELLPFCPACADREFGAVRRGG